MRPGRRYWIGGTPCGRGLALLSVMLAVVAGQALWADEPSPRQYFAIKVVDEATGRGVPLVELSTVHEIRYYTDSAGVAAFYEPGLMDREVFFHVKAHGYEFPADGFGFRGKKLRTTAGGQARLTIKRLNVAERLYRVTGGGIYADSLLVGAGAPLAQPLLNGEVLGSDSVAQAVYQGRIYWFWGDTNRPGYPLGNFHATGATSRLPAEGGLDPSIGVDLDYFVGEDGFARAMAPTPGQGPTWISGPVVLSDRSGRQRMYAGYAKIRNQLEVYRRGLCVFDDGKQQFVPLVVFPEGAPLYPAGHPLRYVDNGVDHVYFAAPVPLVRVAADADGLADVSRYEAMSCLRPGSNLEAPQIDRDEKGRVRFGWKRDTPPVGPAEQKKLIDEGHLKPDEALVQLRDVDSGKPVLAHSGSVYYNTFRRRWLLITGELFGTSVLGEVWYAEADTPTGPWVYARKIVTHEKYSFYNPKHHPVFDQQEGRVIYFEGTYTTLFSGNPHPTPRYEYNQVMYRLDLADPRVVLPVAVYERDGRHNRFTIGAAGQDSRAARLAFFALDRPTAGSVPVFAEASDRGGEHLAAGELRDQPPATASAEASPVFYALPADADSPPPTTVVLYEQLDRSRGIRRYLTADEMPAGEDGQVRRAVCRVWRNPLAAEVLAAAGIVVEPETGAVR